MKDHKLIRDNPIGTSISLTNMLKIEKTTKENTFDFSIPKERQPEYLAELISVIVEDFDDLKISYKAKEEISRRVKEIIDQTREETIREVDGILDEINPAYIGVLESNNNRRYYEYGWEELFGQIKKSLKSLINK